MAIDQLRIHHLRNINAAELSTLGAVNIFYGKNGSGKTSILEAVYMLGLARSFRSHKINSVIAHGQQKLTVFSMLNDGTPLGVEKSVNGDSRLVARGERLGGVSALLPYLPVQLINADSFNLLTGAPTTRRQYLDWGVFHVEHQFFPLWQRYQRAIKQRNVLLRRDRIEDSELDVWDREIVQSGEALHTLRQSYFETLIDAFTEICGRLLPELTGLSLRLQAGWDNKKTLAQSLADNLLSDKERGYTQSGPHRADLRLQVNGYPAADILSRGQTKLVVCALKLAQGLLLNKVSARSAVFLVDDLPAELDEQHCIRVCCELKRLNIQLWMACIEPELLRRCFEDTERDLSVFHVEHGQISPVVVE